ncbi:MAG: thrombospondin type 3 repeat-containing protein [Rubrivivax sp.]
MKIPKHKTIIVAVIIAVGILVWAVMSVSEDTYRSKNPSSVDESFQALLSSQSTQDKDNDGLKDWEEVLWKTDLNNSDTDNDGTKDGEEVSLGRNPLVKGPKDLLPKSDITPSTTALAPENLTLTDKFARDFFAIYASQKALGKTPDPNLEKTLIDNFLQSNLDVKNKIIYGISDIRVGQDTTEKALKAYGNGIGTILIKYGNTMTVADTALVVQKSMETENKKELEKLNPLISSYRGVVNDLLLLTVPSVLISEHLDFINNAQALVEDVEGMKYIFDDPLQSLVYLRRYMYSSSVNTLESIQQIKAFLSSHGITFQQEESGYVLISNI